MGKICTLVQDDCRYFQEGQCRFENRGTASKLDLLCANRNAVYCHRIAKEQWNEINIMYQAKILETQKKILEALQRQK